MIKNFMMNTLYFLIRPKVAFTTLECVSIKQAIVRTTIYGLSAGIISLIYNLAGASLSVGQEWYLSLFLPVLMAIIILISGSFFLFLLAKIGKGKKDIGCCFHVISACQVILPVNALCSVSYSFDIYWGAGLHLLIGMWGLIIFYKALVTIMDLDKLLAVFVYVCFFLLLVFSAGVIIFQATMLPKMMQELKGGAFYEEMKKSGMDSRQLDMLQKQINRANMEGDKKAN